MTPGSRSLEEQGSLGLYSEGAPGDGPSSPGEGSLFPGDNSLSPAGTQPEDGPTLRFLQSESLRKACLYISQKAVMESMASVRSQDAEREREREQEPEREQDTELERNGDVQTFGEKGLFLFTRQLNRELCIACILKWRSPNASGKT